jgi:hypothetical protein
MTETTNDATSATQTGEQTAPVPETTPKAEQRQAKRDEQVRTRLKAVEGELSSLREQYDGMVQGEVHRLLAGVVSDPAMVLKASETTPASFIDETTGIVNAQAVLDFADTFVKDHPLFRAGPPPISGAHQHPVRAEEIAHGRKSSSWGEELSQRRR